MRLTKSASGVSALGIVDAASGIEVSSACG
jgi:hypothetical protein